MELRYFDMNPKKQPVQVWAKEFSDAVATIGFTLVVLVGFYVTAHVLVAAVVGLFN